MAADKSILFLLLIDALKDTNREHPKTTKELIQDVAAAWQELYPDEPPATISPSTVGRHIKAMNKSGLYHIATCKNAKDGYYCNKFTFEAAEFSIIAQALYRSVAISTAETRSLLQKFLNNTDDLGEEYLDIMMKQMQRTSPRRKPTRATLPIINTILDAIWKQKKLRFTYYEHHDRNPDNMKKRSDKETGKTIQYVVSPYYLVWNMDECYLIAHCERHDSASGKHLSHFKVSLIAEPAKLDYEPACSIRDMKEYRRYTIQRTIPEYKAVVEYAKKASTEDDKHRISNRKALVKFSLDRYMRENLFMFHDDSPLVDIRLYFRKNFLGTLMAQFNLDRYTIKAYPTDRTFPDGEKVISAIITVQPNEGLYMWLSLQCTNVMVVEPDSIRTELKKRLESSLNAIKAYENGPHDPIDQEQLEEDQKKIAFADMWREMMDIPSDKYQVNPKQKEKSDMMLNTILGIPPENKL
ncbi:helix-turn-helix transcriptional regulator [Selenomonas sp. KH1T6]|uniref:helix-turn-helix transcriptional regulator n=1 Tax=Selenomonas sp. KH1T6 TaxID=3158784 RepID=UPI0008A72B7D|nr:WYL domain-containing protein [Selenomonas ruminantium]